jgi:amino acid adenylation domain-containing protein
MVFDPYADAEAIVRLTPLQQAMLAHSRFAGGGAYVGQMSVRLRGQLDPARVESAFRQLVARHEALRTIFVGEGLDEPLQVAQRSAELALRVEDLTGAADAEAWIEAFLDADRVTPFDLLTPPLMRVALFRLGEERWHLVLTRHHLIMDGWSATLLFRELEALIAGAGDLPAAEPFHRFVEWLETRDHEASRAYWREALAGAGEGTAIFPGERLARGELPATLHETIRPLDTALVEQVAAAARRRGVTQQTLYAGAWAMLAARYSGGNAAQFGVTIAGRPEELAGATGTVGLFIDTVPLAVRTGDDVAVGPWLEALQHQLAEAGRHAHLGLAALRESAGLAADQALFSHILVLEAYGNRAEPAEDALDIQDYRFIDQTNFALNIGVVQDRQSHLAAVFDPGRIAPAAAERLLANFETAIRAIAEADVVLGEIDVIAGEERERLHVLAGDGDPIPAESLTLPARLAEAVAHHGTLTALEGEGAALSYAELWAQAGQVAAALQARGVGCERLVGLALPRSIAQVIAILGVIRAGGAFVPLDPDDPAARRESMAADAGLGLVLGPDEIATMLAGPQADPPLPDLPGNAAAYALFTSGSTGRPKAALNGQRAIVNRLDWMQRAYPIGPGDRVLQKTASTFDVAVWEFLWPLLEGATLVLAGPSAHRDPAEIRDAVESQRITVLHLVPSLLRLFLALPGVERCTSLRHLIVSGEALDADLPGLMRAKLPGAALHNLYGPAEAAIDVTFQEMDGLAPGETVPIGRPIDGATIRLLDRGGRPVPLGAIGELVIGGAAGGRGYVGRADLTAERFVPDAAGARRYRTGDLACWDEAGRLIFHGRADDQVKLRGHRIELGEIEAALRSIDGVADAAVTIQAKGTADAALTAHLVSAEPAEPGDALIERTRAALRTMLPRALVPGGWQVAASLPRLPSQKIDRRALSAMAAPAIAASIPPRTEEEALLASLWSEVLGQREIGVTDDFFALGGHSLLLVRLANLIERDFGVPLELAELFDATTIERQIELILDKLLLAADPELAESLMAEFLPR